MSVERPTHVLISYVKWKIKWLDDKEWYRTRRHDGAQAQTEGERSLISMRADGIKEVLLRETLLHELMHACFDSVQYGEYIPDDKGEAEEYFIRHVNPGLYHTLTRPENAKVFRYLFDL